MSTQIAIAIAVAALVLGLMVGAFGRTSFLMLGILMLSGVKRLALPAVIILVVAAGVIGGIAAMSGGSFMVAAKYAFLSGAGLAVLALVVRCISAMKGPW